MTLQSDGTKQQIQTQIQAVRLFSDLINHFAVVHITHIVFSPEKFFGRQEPQCLNLHVR